MSDRVIESTSPKAAWKKELLASLAMIVWMAVVWRLFVRQPGGQIGYYVGSDAGQFWKEHYFIPLLSDATFLVAPFLGGCSAVRLMRSRKPFAVVAGAFLIIVFVAVFLFFCVPQLMSARLHGG